MPADSERERLPKSLQTVPFPSTKAVPGSVNPLRGQTPPACTILLSGQPPPCDGNAHQLRVQWSAPKIGSACACGSVVAAPDAPPRARRRIR